MNEYQESHLKSREKSSTGYFCAVQKFSNASENAMRTSAAGVAFSKRTEENSFHTSKQPP